MQRQKIIKALTGVFAAALLVWRCFFGLGWQDEAMHLAWVKRLYEGAVPLQEEWHVCQLSAALLIPFYALYQRVGPAFPGGAILFFRLLYMGFWILGSLYSYCLMRRVFDRGISFVIMLHILLYCRSNIFTLSYISMGPMFFLLAMLSWYVLAFHREGWPGKAVKWLGMIGGVLCAGGFVQSLWGRALSGDLRLSGILPEKGEGTGTGVVSGRDIVYGDSLQLLVVFQGACERSPGAAPLYFVGSGTFRERQCPVADMQILWASGVSVPLYGACPCAPGGKLPGRPAGA